MRTKKFEITGKCNLSCEACYNKNMLKSLRDIDIKDILERISEGNTVYIGGGEPMIHPKIQEITQRLVEIPTEVVISTNGIIYKKMPLETQIQISVWTLNQRLYKEILNGTERQFLESDENTGRYISDGNSVFLNMPVYKKNFMEIDDISDYADSLSIPLRINLIFPVNGFSVDSNLERKIENSVLKLKLSGRNIIYSGKKKQIVERFYNMTH